jgi:CheY-like chemotaxis protein
MSEAQSHVTSETDTRTHERRRKTRVLISTPVRLRNRDGAEGALDDTTTTINLSPNGILITTADTAYRHGMWVILTVPYSETAGPDQPEQEGRVVRTSELRNGLRSVAIALELGAADKNPYQLDEKSTELATSPLVLVVESEVVASEFMKTYLSAEGYEVVTARTVAEAYGVLDQCTPSLLIAEIEGEDQPGYALCAHFKETPRLKRVPVMLMTSSAYPSDYAKAHSLGAVVCMAKPYKRERLGHVVRLLAPPPHASKETAPPRPADASRRADAPGRVDASAGGPVRAKGGKFSLLRRKRR